MRRLRPWSSLLAILLVQGCNEADPGVRPLVQAVGNCRPGAGGNDCTNANGTGIHIAHTWPESSFGLVDDLSGGTWRWTGITNTPTGVVANGWYEGEGAPVAVDGQVTEAVYQGALVPVNSIEVDGTTVKLHLAQGPQGDLVVNKPHLIGVVLHVQVPDVTLTGTVQFDLRFDEARTLAAGSPPIPGYVLSHRRTGSSGAWQSYCRDGQNQALTAVFVAGQEWNPNDAAKTSGSEMASVSCEGGAIVSCLEWGFRPWETGARIDPNAQVSLGDFHQACIHMKRAAYCGDAKSYTYEGTPFVMSKSLVPAPTTDLAHIEAIWTPSGAACLTQARHPEIVFQGCPQPLPACPSVMPSGWLLASGMP